ncbi:MAG: bifunctional ornithine acetyltransferase/N-acetylglutamate synthase, partial [Burkholderiales bacterium]|nr:bifunctional ornithine acetyltransferase/N-acetylglutamate synthase [Anaerolineae bacterium]
ASGIGLETEEDRQNFEIGLSEVCRKLAQDVVYDGEGVTKFITVRVTGAPDDESARDIANTIAISPLVKTAFFGNDANWGRIMMAAGRAGVPLVQERLNLWFAPGEVYQVTSDALQLVEGGTPTGFDETKSTSIVSQAKVTVLLDCGIGDGAATIWTCDLSHDYVSINGDYRS